MDLNKTPDASFLSTSGEELSPVHSRATLTSAVRRVHSETERQQTSTCARTLGRAEMPAQRATAAASRERAAASPAAAARDRSAASPAASRERAAASPAPEVETETPAATSSPRVPVRGKGKGRGKGRATSAAAARAPVQEPTSYTVDGACEYLAHLTLEEQQTVRQRMEPGQARASPTPQESIFLRRPDGGVYLRLADGTTVETGGPVREVDLRAAAVQQQEDERAEDDPETPSKCSAQ